MPVSAPADRRFRRKHVKPVRRAAMRGWWKRLAIVIVTMVLAVPVVAAMGRAAVSSTWLAVSSVVVTGNTRVAEGEIDSLLDGLIGSSMLTLDVERWRDRLRTSPWIADAAIRRIFPDTVSIVISERMPAAIGQRGEALFLVDRLGLPIEEYGPRYAELDLPIVNGLGGGSAGAWSSEGRKAAVVVRLFDALQRRPDLAGRISQIDVTDPANVVFVLKDDPALVRVGDDQFVERLLTYIEVAQHLRDRVRAIEYVDVRHGDRIFVKPQPTAVRDEPARADKG
jgi:cell division protein FtsQ